MSRLCKLKYLLFALLFTSQNSLAKQQLKVSLLYSNGTQRAVYTKLFSQFSEHNPDIHLQIKSHEAENYKANFAKWLKSDKHSDLMYWFSGEKLRSLVKQGLIRNLDQVWQDNHWQQQFSTGAISTVTYQNSQYGLPIHYYPWAIYYKKELFKRLHITPPQDWPSFLAACSKLQQHNITPIVIGSKNYWTLAAWFDYLNLRINGLTFHNALVAGEVSYLDPKIINVFHYWQQLIEKGYFLSEHQSLTWRSALPYLYREKAGMMLMGNFWTSQIPKALYQKIDMFRFPTINSELAIYEEAPTDIWIIPENSQNSSAAIRLLKFLADPDVQQELNSALGMISPNPASQKSEDHFINGSYQILAAAAGVSQFYDRDNPQPIASEGIKEFARFMKDPTQLLSVLNNLEKLRLQSFNIKTNNAH